MTVKPIRILFVCTGNICRSPSAEGIFRDLVLKRGLADQFEVDSAGISAYHVGESPDSRSAAEARKHGVDLSPIRSSRIAPSDFQHYDLLLAMDYSHFNDMKAMAPEQVQHKIHLFLELTRDEERTTEVPDPYYGGPSGFEHVFFLIQRACDAWLNKLTIN